MNYLCDRGYSFAVYQSKDCYGWEVGRYSCPYEFAAAFYRTWKNLRFTYFTLWRPYNVRGDKDDTGVYNFFKDHTRHVPWQTVEYADKWSKFDPLGIVTAEIDRLYQKDFAE